MILCASIFCLSLGTIGACLVEKFTNRRLMIKRSSGVMIVIGLVLIGMALPLFR